MSSFWSKWLQWKQVPLWGPLNRTVGRGSQWAAACRHSDPTLVALKPPDHRLCSIFSPYLSDAHTHSSVAGISTLSYPHPLCPDKFEVILIPFSGNGSPSPSSIMSKHAHSQSLPSPIWLSCGIRLQSFNYPSLQWPVVCLQSDSPEGRRTGGLW